jgi:DNA polymerase-1
MTLEQAEDFRARFFRTYTGISAWHRQLSRNPSAEGRTLTGRRFTYGKDSGLSFLTNTPVQGTAADIVKKALGFLAQRLKGTDTKIVGVVHDEILLEAQDEGAEDAARILKSSMEEAGNSILSRIPCQADAVISQSWTKG